MQMEEMQKEKSEGEKEGERDGWEAFVVEWTGKNNPPHIALEYLLNQPPSLSFCPIQ